MPLTPPKQFKHYEELIDILIERGMVINNRERAIRKLAQVGYYRLSGFGIQQELSNETNHINPSSVNT